METAKRRITKVHKAIKEVRGESEEQKANSTTEGIRSGIARTLATQRKERFADVPGWQGERI